MDASIIAALVSSSASLVVSISGAAWTVRQDIRARAEKAADLTYLEAPDHRGETALLSTLHRFASYFAQCEALRPGLQFAHIDDASTNAVADLLASIGVTFASDSLDWDVPDSGSRFMFWHEEQRAIGELMLDRPEKAGYAAFTAAYEEHFAPWFATCAADLKDGRAAVSSNRLERVRYLLRDLVIKLDTDGVYVRRGKDGALAWEGWMARAARPEGPSEAHP
jgi:hypothetical protein